MKKVWFASAVFSAFLLLSGGETLTAHWDFTKGIHSRCGKFRMNRRANTALVKDGENGTFLRVSPDGKKAAGIITQKKYKELSPKGGFRVEVKFRLAPGKARAYQYLLDSKYVSYFHKRPAYNKGFIVSLVRGRGKEPSYTAQVNLGLGSSSVTLQDAKKVLTPGQIYTFSFSWDGASTGRFSWDGKESKVLYIKNGSPVAEAFFPLSIGDRLYSGYQPFEGDIFEVKLYTFPAREKGLMFRADQRRVFLRNEKDAFLRLSLLNESDSALTHVTVQGRMNTQHIPVQKIPAVEKKQTLFVPIPVETRLTPGWRDCSFTASYVCNGKKRSETLSFRYGIAPLTGDFMPVVIWGFSLPYTLFKEYGFTHGMKYAYMGDFTREHANRYDVLPERYRELDSMLMDSFRAVGSFHVDRFLKQWPRIAPDGKPYKNNQNFDAAHTEGVALVTAIAEEAAGAFSGHIGMDGLLINSEVRDRSKPSFGKHNLAQWQAHSALKAFPAGVSGRSAPHWSTLPDFPLSRIIDPADVLLRYYRFFWKEGDGWNPIHTRIHEAFKKRMKHKNFWTFYDPAVRVPPLWGSGGNVDYLSHWTYTYPNPINIMANMSEMFAMQKGNPSQGVMNMTQIICYRSQTAPAGKKVPKAPAWVKKFPKAPYITLSPDMMQEALWAQIAKKVSGIMFHGYNSLFTDPASLGDTGYQCTNPHTKTVLKKFLHEVVRPLGPVLKRVNERPFRIGVLESFASHVYAGRGSMGWGTWVFDLNVALHWANLHYGVIYEEEVLKGGLDSLSVLILPHCDVLPRDVYQKIIAFQKRGGILVGDEFLTPALLPDFSIQSVRKDLYKPLETKKALQDMALRLRKEITPYCRPYVETSNGDLVAHVRKDREADYLFVINDKRTFGDYFGPYGMVAEKGVPNKGVIRLRRTDVQAVYDLVKGKEVPFRKKGAWTEIEANFTTSDGRLYLILPQKIRALDGSLSAGKVTRGGSVTVQALPEGSRSRIRSLHPVQLTVTDPAGRVTDDSTYSAMNHGIYQQKITIPLDGKKGLWRVTLRELASGKSKTLSFRVH